MENNLSWLVSKLEVYTIKKQGERIGNFKPLYEFNQLDNVIIQTRSKTIQKPAPVFQNNEKNLETCSEVRKFDENTNSGLQKPEKSTNFSFSNPKTAKSHTENPIYSKTFTRHESQNSSFPIENSEKQENLFENSIKNLPSHQSHSFISPIKSTLLNPGSEFALNFS